MCEEGGKEEQEEEVKMKMSIQIATVVVGNLSVYPTNYRVRGLAATTTTSNPIFV